MIKVIFSYQGEKLRILFNCLVHLCKTNDAVLSNGFGIS